MALAMWIVAIFVGYHVLVRVPRWYRQSRWTKTTAVVTDVHRDGEYKNEEWTYRTVVGYSYRSPDGSMRTSSHEVPTTFAVRRGDQIDVFVNPSDPDASMLPLDLHELWRGMGNSVGKVVGMVVFVGGFFLFWFVVGLLPPALGRVPFAVFGAVLALGGGSAVVRWALGRPRRDGTVRLPATISDVAQLGTDPGRPPHLELTVTYHDGLQERVARVNSPSLEAFYETGGQVWITPTARADEVLLTDPPGEKVGLVGPLFVALGGLIILHEAWHPQP